MGVSGNVTGDPLFLCRTKTTCPRCELVEYEPTSDWYGLSRSVTEDNIKISCLLFFVDGKPKTLIRGDESKIGVKPPTLSHHKKSIEDGPPNLEPRNSIDILKTKIGRRYKDLTVDRRE